MLKTLHRSQIRRSALSVLDAFDHWYNMFNVTEGIPTTDLW